MQGVSDAACNDGVPAAAEFLAMGFDCGNANAEAGGEVGAGSLFQFITAEMGGEGFEDSGQAGLGPFLAQLGHCGIKQGGDVAAIKEVFGAAFVVWLGEVALVGGHGIEGDGTLRGAARGHVVTVGVVKEVLEAAEQEAAELAPDLIGGIEDSLLNDAEEEALGEVFGVLLAAALAADERIDGEPIQCAEVAESGAGAVIVIALTGGDDAPAGGGEGGISVWFHRFHRCRRCSRLI